MNKSYKFFFHYNKPASLSAGTPKLSIHWKDICHVVDEIVCNVVCSTKHNKRQPKCVMAGKSSSIEFRNSEKGRIAVINN